MVSCFVVAPEFGGCGTGIFCILSMFTRTYRFFFDLSYVRWREADEIGEHL